MLPAMRAIGGGTSSSSSRHHPEHQHQRPLHATKSGVVHRKKCRHPKTAADLVHRFCLVCSCKAENYNFGVVSCESCKAFFRRNAHKQTLGEAGFACSFRRGGCEVSLVTRKKCPGCRLAKCFAVGMQADLIQKVDQLPATQMPPWESQSQSSSMSPSASLSEQLAQAMCQQEHGEHLLRLWQQLQTPAPSSSQLPASFIEPGCNEAAAAADHRWTNILLVDFFDELRRLVRDTMLGDITATVQLPNLSASGVPILEAFVQRAANFIGGLRQLDQLERPHFVALLRCRLHSVLFPLSCSGFSHLDGKFYFTINGQRVCCQPIDLFCDLVRRATSRLVDFTPLADVGVYTGHLLAVTEMRPELLALFCAAKLLHLPADCGIADARLRRACARLALRYHQHLIDSLYYHYPFDFDAKLEACCRLFKWSQEFDRTLESFIQHCPVTMATAATIGKSASD